LVERDVPLWVGPRRDARRLNGRLALLWLVRLSLFALPILRPPAIIIIMVTTATHNVATTLEIRAELLTGLAPLDGKAGARKRFKSRRKRRVAHKVVHPGEPPT
jgi:hypothetical protein